MGKGLGMGYKNIVQRDPYIHALSAKGIKSQMYEVVIKKQAKPFRASDDKYEYFDREIMTFRTLDEAKSFLKDNYGKFKPQKMYQDDKDGKPIEVGKIYNYPYSEYNRDTGKYEKYTEQDWVYLDKVTKESELSAKGKKLNALGKVWTQVVRKILPHETRVRGKIANTLRDDEIETILETMEFFGASDQVIAQAHSDMKIPRYRMGDWLGMFIQNEGYDKAGGETATKVLAHAYIKADGDIDKMIQDLRENDYQVDTSWEKIDLREE